MGSRTPRSKEGSYLDRRRLVESLHDRQRQLGRAWNHEEGTLGLRDEAECHSALLDLWSVPPILSSGPPFRHLHSCPAFASRGHRTQIRCATMPPPMVHAYVLIRLSPGFEEAALQGSGQSPGSQTSRPGPRPVSSHISPHRLPRIMPEGIDQSLVDEVWRALNDYDQVQAQGEARAFIRNQPHVAAFLRELTEEFDQEVQKAALGLVFLLFKVVEAHRGTSPGPISRERIQGAYDAATTWMERWDGATEDSSFGGLGPQGSFRFPIWCSTFSRPFMPATRGLMNMTKRSGVVSFSSSRPWQTPSLSDLVLQIG